MRIKATDAAKAEKAARLAEEAERRKAATMAGYFVKAFQVSDPLHGGRHTKIIDFLDAAVELLETERDLSPEIKATVLSTFGNTYVGIDASEQGVELVERSLKLIREELGPNHPTLALTNNLALVYTATGRLDDAVLLHEQALDDMRQQLGPNHSRVVVAEFNLARSLQRAGKLPQAIPHFEEVLKHKERPGTDRLAMLAAMHELATAYFQVGRYDDALPLFKEALAARRAKLGSGHPETLTTMHNLAILFTAVDGGLGQAAPLFEEALAGRTEKLGRDDPLTISTAESLAYVYRETGRFDEAIPLFQRALAHRESKFGTGHPDTLQNVHNLARAYEGAKRFEDAIALRERHLATTRKTLGPDDPDTLLSMNLLAVLYWQSGKLAQSIPMFEEQLKSLQTRGAEGPETLITMANLAANYRDAGRLPEAIVLFEETLHSLLKHPGCAPNLMASVPRDIAFAYDLAGEFGKSEPFYREFLANARKERGNDDLDTAATMAQLATNLLFQRKFADAEPLLRECLAVREAKIADDWSTFNSRSLLGGSLLGQKEYADAEPLLVAGYEGMRERVDRIPPQGKVRVHEALERVVQLYDERGKPDEAAQWRAKEPLSPATLMAMRMRYRAAAELFQQAFASYPALVSEPAMHNRFNGACVAALAAAGQGADAADVTVEERVRWRKQALDWLRADLDALKQRLTSDSGSRMLMVQSLSHWQQDPDLDSVRDDDGLAALASDEQTAWRELWSDVAELAGSASASAP